MNKMAFYQMIFITQCLSYRKYGLVYTMYIDLDIWHGYVV